MNRQKWFLCGAALACMLLGAGLIARLKSAQQLGKPGLKVGVLEEGRQLEVQLPLNILDCTSARQPITTIELETLPKDTTFGRRIYQAADGFMALATVVMMGTDRTSIHKPQFCLAGQGWRIDRAEPEMIPIEKPHSYQLPVMKLITSKTAKLDGHDTALRGVYIYWFVADNRLTARHWQRMWWMAEGLLRHGILQRWSYVTFFAVCAPGQEAATFERLSQVIAAAVPEFQLTTGPQAAAAERPESAGKR